MKEVNVSIFRSPKKKQTSTHEPYLYFNEVLPESDIYKLGKVYYSFTNEIINYKEMEELFKKAGYPIVDTPHKDPTDGRVCKTMKQREELESRISNELYKDSDIYTLILEYNGEKVLFKRGRDLIEVMAKNGDEDAKKRLDNIKQSEMRLSAGLKGTRVYKK